MPSLAGRSSLQAWVRYITSDPPHALRKAAETASPV